MSFNKKLFAMLAAGALTAAAAVPALALENEFHGMMGVRATNSNYLGGGGTGYLLAPTGAVDSKTTNNWIEQRARLFYTAKANDNLKLVTGFEIDTTWGKSSYVVSRANDGGALGADSVNLETKWVYLDFNEPNTGANFKVGLQGLNDAYKGLIVGGGADAAGIQISKAMSGFTGTVGFFRLDDRSDNASPPTFSNGKKTRDFLLLDGKFAVNKDTKVGASYYFLNSDNSITTAAQAINNGPTVATGAVYDYNVHMIGVNAATTVGPATVDGYGIYQFGTAGTTHVNSFAANLGAKVKAGSMGTAKVNALYVNGGSNFFVDVNNENSGAFSENSQAGSFGNMFILVRNSFLTTNDQYIVYNSGNRGMGIMGGSVGFDASITDKAFANVNAGFLAVAKENTGHKSNYQGTEINAELGYKFYDSLTGSVRAAYVFLGDFYKGKGTAATDPANPYLAQLTLSYVF